MASLKIQNLYQILKEQWSISVSQIASSRLTLFSFLVAWANLLHQLSFPSTWIKDLEPIGWSLFLVSLAGILRPSSLRIFATLITLRVIYTLLWTPMIRGHLFLEGLLSLGIMIGFGMGLWKLRHHKSLTTKKQEDLFESFAPFLRVTCLIVYIAVTLSKLNVDFINPEKSAAVQLLVWAHQQHPNVPTGPWALQISIWGTLIFEAGIPILLLFRKTRWLGLIIGLFFNTLLGFLPLKIASFTLVMCLLLFSWMPRESPDLIRKTFQGIVKSTGISAPLFTLLIYLAAGTTGLLYAGRNGISLDMHAIDLGLGIWWWQTAIMLIALWSIRKAPNLRANQLMKSQSAPLWIWITFIAFNVLCPYIGLKTRSALSMHCNLRTERGYWNHLFLPSQMRLFSYQDDLVEITNSDLPDFAHLKKKGMPLPYFEFRRWCHLAPQDFFVEYRRNENPLQRFEKRDSTGSDPTLTHGPRLLEWFLCFNPVGASHDYIPELVKRTGPARNVVPPMTDLTKE
jgi:hypothetical protein